MKIDRSIATDRFVGKDVPREIGVRLITHRILNKCVPGPNGCLLWTGTCYAKGYGQTSAYGKTVRTHRIVWEAANGPIPPGKIICHSCDTPPCNNIDHMWLGTVYSNGQDAKQKGRCKYQKVDRCIRGHEFTPENTRLTKQGFRACKTCQRGNGRRLAGWPKDRWYEPPGRLGFRPSFEGEKR